MTTDTNRAPLGRFSLVPGRIVLTRFRVRGEAPDDKLPAEARTLHMRAYTEMERISQRVDGLGYIVAEENLKTLEDTIKKLQETAEQFNWVQSREGVNYAIVLDYCTLPYASANPELERFVVRDILATLQELREKLVSKNKKAILNSSLVRTYGKMATITTNPRYRAVVDKAFDDLKAAQSLARRGMLETTNVVDTSHIDAAIAALSQLETANDGQRQ